MRRKAGKAPARRVPLQMKDNKLSSIPIIKGVKARGGLKQYALAAARRVFYYARASRRLGEESVIEVNGYRLHLDVRNDAGLTRELYIYRKWENNVTDFLSASGIIPGGGAVLDIGANIGYYTCLFSGLAGNSGVVYAVEPVSDSRLMLGKNLRLNNIKNAEIHACAMGEADGEDSICVSRKKNWSGFYPEGLPEHVPAEDIVKMEKVRVLSVDSFLRGKKIPCFIRMDLEGYEYSVLRGMPRTLEEDLSLLVEMHMGILGPEKREKIILLLKNKGFKEAVVFKKRNPLPDASIGIEELTNENQTCNVLFTKNPS